MTRFFKSPVNLLAPTGAAHKRFTALAALAIGAAIAIAPASAQVQVQQGQALDASNQVGSGGSNNPVPGYYPQNANSYGVINSGGARLNYQVVPVPLPGGGTSYARIPQISQSPFVNASVSPGQAELSRVNAVSAGISSFSAQQLVNGQSSFIAGNTLGQNALGVSPNGTNPDYLNNALNSALTSPPTNLPYGNLGSALPPGSLYNYNPGTASNGLVTGGNSQVSSLFGLRQVHVQEAVNQNDLGMRPDGTYGRLNNKVKSGLNSADNANNKSQRPTDFIVNSKVPAAPLGDKINAGGKAVPVGQALNSLSGSQVAPGSRPAGDLYQQLLAELSSGRKTIITAPGLAGKSAMSLTTLAPRNLNQEQMLTVDPITGLPIAPLTASRVHNSIASGPAAKTGGKTPAYIAPGTGALLHEENELIPKHLVRVLQAGQKVHILNSLVGRAPGAFNQEMARGQAAMKKGKFIRAMDAYQGAMMLNQTNPLPIVGRAHAELAAGLYDTAAYDLKFVFRRHPELTAIRYNLKKLLPAITITAVNKDLAGLLKEKSKTGAFLSAYMAYQAGNRAELKKVLAEWAKWRNGGMWPAMLSQAWLHRAKTTPHGAKP